MTQRPDFSSGPRPLTQQEIESLRKNKEDVSARHQEYFRKLKAGQTVESGKPTQDKPEE